MNLVDFLIKKKAIGDRSKRSAVAISILTMEMPASVTVTPESPKGVSTSELIRFYHSDHSRTRTCSPLEIRGFRQALESLATGDMPDLTALRQIHVDGESGSDDIEQPPHIAYLVKLLSGPDRLSAKALRSRCEKAAKAQEEGCPFVMIDDELCRKDTEKSVADGTFDNWATDARNLLKNQ